MAADSPAREIDTDRSPTELPYLFGENSSATTDIQTRPAPVAQQLIERASDAERIRDRPVTTCALTGEERVLIPLGDSVVCGVRHGSIRSSVQFRIHVFGYGQNRRTQVPDA